MKKITLILYVILTQSLFARDFTFNKDFDGWGNWGNGMGSHDHMIGYRSKGSLKLATDVNEVQTVHFESKEFKPGIYKITAFVRSNGINPSSDKTSFWHFYDAGKGIQNVFTELDGRYNWRKVEYTVKVEGTALTVWFRLRSPGEVWIDDVSIIAVSDPLPLLISPANDLKIDPIKSKQIQKISSKVLLDFDKNINDHPFDVLSIDRQNTGRFTSQKYYNFDVSDYLNADWSKFDRIELDVFNGNKENVEFFLTLADEQTTNYWSQLNHKTHLGSGWNHISFSLSQFLGERGSHRVNRELNLSKIKKWFIVADHSEKYEKNSNFYIDNIKLISDVYPKVPAKVTAFDFTSKRDHVENGFIKVTANHLFRKDLEYGFIDTQFWRVEDAQWVASPLRYSIGVTKGKFRVSLPNGKYSMNLNIERLGYWDVSFWQNRLIQINGKTVFKESRKSPKDFLQDWLRFENIIPEFNQHPYDLYVKPLFKPLEFSFDVKDGLLDIAFIGDATGINLNSLVIWEPKDSVAAKKFLAQVEDRMKLEFDWMSRSIKQKSLLLPNHVISIIEPTLSLKPQEIYPEVSKDLQFNGGINEISHQVIQLRGQGEVSWLLEDLVNENSKTLPAKNIVFSEIIPQFVSSDLNHETYFLAGKYLKETIQSRIQLDGNSTHFLMLQLKIPEGLEPGTYKSKLIINNSLKKTAFDVVVRVLNYQLPRLDFPVGFFGPDPISPTYFEGAGIEKLRLDYKIKAIELLGKSGFTTFTSFPEVKLNKETPFWTLDTTSLDAVLKAAEKAGMVKTYFSYGGSFPSAFFDGSLKPADMTEDLFFKKVSPLLRKYLDTKGFPKLVYTFSDEASGYSDKVNEDLEKGKKIKAFFPFMHKGGFGSKSDPSTTQLNSLFNFGFYSNVTKTQMLGMNRNEKWGTYNAAPGNLDDPRFAFGPGLYYAYKSGLNHYLEWHSTGIQNYPFYDLDGRESDVVMFYPSLNGELYSTVRFVMATEGLHILKKLLLLEKHLDQNKNQEFKEAKDWLANIKKGVYSSSTNVLKPGPGFDFKTFKKKLDVFLSDPRLFK